MHRLQVLLHPVLLHLGADCRGRSGISTEAFSIRRLGGSRWRLLERLHRELMELNPSAARSLEEGMEDTLTVHRLRVPAQLRRTLASTNVIESALWRSGG